MFNVIKEEKINDNCPGESQIKRGVYYNTIAEEYEWLTLTRSGRCKKLSTAMRKAGF